MFLAGKLTSSQWRLGVLTGEKGDAVFKSKLIIMWQIGRQLTICPNQSMA